MSGDDLLKNKSLAPSNETQTSEDEFEASWGFNVAELYALSTTFIREKEGKAFHLSYGDKVRLVALGQQAAHGRCVEAKTPPVGYLDVIGRDRRQAWRALGDMSEREAKSGFVNLLNEVCPLFRPFVLAHKCHLQDMERRKREEEEEERRRREEQELELQVEEEEQRRLEEERRMNRERQQGQQKRLIQEALNRQTFHQFKGYAEKQFPSDPEQQAVLIRQLQEQHYQQYMQQVLQEQLPPTTPLVQPHNSSSQLPQGGIIVPREESSSPDGSEEELCDPLPVPVANMWTRGDLPLFKESVRKEGGEGVITVGHGETVTVRVPTHSDGRCLFWEFATDSFDLGFGVYFEWTGTPTDPRVTVHVSDSEDDEEEEEELDPMHGDVEKGAGGSQDPRPPLSVVVPVYRRDCHLEVYAGSHAYPGPGVYLLKFDNSYSLWRAKTLYYRVYYTR